MFKTVKMIGISSFTSAINFLILLHKAVVAFWRVLRGEKVVPVDEAEPAPSPQPTPYVPPPPPAPTPYYPLPINIIWDSISGVIADHIFNNLFGANAKFKAPYYNRQWILDFIRNDPVIKERVAEVLKDVCKIEDEQPPSEST